MLGRNVFVGLIGSVWIALLGLAVVPLYLKYLGVEAYGLIGFFATTQAMFQLLDMGLTPTLGREVARHAADGRLADCDRLLHTLACIFWGASALIALAALLGAPAVASNWLQAKRLPPSSVEQAVTLLGVVIACRWPIGLYQAAIAGAQRIAVSSTINVAATTTASLGAVMILAFVSPTIEAFFIWQAACGIAHALLMRHAAWAIVGGSRSRRFDTQELRRIWRFSAEMSVVAMLGVVLTQMDKVLLSRLLDLDSYGQYMLAAVVVGGLYVVVTPVFNAIYPRLSALVAAGELAQVQVVYSLGTRTLGALLFPLAMFVAICARDLVALWTGNPLLAAEIAPLVSLLAAGSALHGIVHLPHALQLAHGNARLTIIMGTTMVTLYLPLLVVLVRSHGAVGGSAAWLCLNILYLGLTSWLTGRHVLASSRISWIGRDVAVPLAVAGAVGGLLWHVVHRGGFSPTVNVLAGISAMTLAMALNAALDPLRSVVQRRFATR